MKLTKYALATGVLAAMTAGIHPVPTTEVDPLTKKERFALELKACQEAWASDKPGKCELYGKIEIVDHFGDVKVEVVDHFADIRVQWVEHFPNEPGKWQKVDHFADYKVEIVDHFGDYKVEFVDHFPGCD